MIPNNREKILLSSSPNSNPYWRLFMFCYSIGVATGSGLGYGFSQATSNIKQQELLAQTEIHRFSRAEYERLLLGMSQAQVEAILYRGTEIKRSETTSTFTWKNPDDSRITAIFENGKLKTKEQFGLK